ncbi:hypothetical protein Mth01_50190 [Sphaerimonospora thailandensis]|uniref:Uncharacterized protein n=2 Tax=Sphaerimonospora thailandensis TaxID=795644 RepID=A0A8J3W2G3_9ACTN|nr:hypothetical protein Mth01_50190 [Sphaerimonospora thailandensis]
MEPAGNVKTTPLAEILAGPAWQELLTRVPRRADTTAGKPNSDGNDCAPAETICEGNALILPVRGRQVVGLAGTAR